MQYHNEGKKYDEANEPVITLFDEYFGGGMNTVVFQELRESRGLAYSAWASYYTPSKKVDPEYFCTNIISQNDKMMDCIRVFNNIMDTVPQSQKAFDIAKQAVMKRLEASRTTKLSIIFKYLNAKRLGQDYDINERIYKAIPNVTLSDLVKFVNDNISHKPFRYLILGDEKELDLNALEKDRSCKETYNRRDLRILNHKQNREAAGHENPWLPVFLIHTTNNMRINIIAAVSRNRAIGNNNKLVYWLPNDLKRFKALTTGHTILMGRKTFESLPKGALPNRRNIVVSHTVAQLPGCDVYPSIDEALANCNNEEDVYVIGGKASTDSHCRWPTGSALQRLTTKRRKPTLSSLNTRRNGMKPHARNIPQTSAMPTTMPL